MMKPKPALGSLEWIVTLRDPVEGFQDNPWFVVTELLFIVFGILLLKHAIREGGRYLFLWVTVVMYAIVAEVLSASHPDIDNFWHGQATVMLLGQRLPLYILFVYCSFLYPSVVVVRHLELPWWGQPFAAGVSCLLFDLPMDVMSTKHLFWTWHDTDPNLADRHFHVPWANFNFFLVFGSAFYIIFCGLHKLLAWNRSIFSSAGKLKEAICSISTTLLTFPLGVIFFTVYYDPFHVYFELHSEECVLSLATIYGIIVWIADRKTLTISSGKGGVTKASDEILLVMVLHYCYLILMSVLSEPQHIRSTGIHEPVGPCNETSEFYSLSTGKALKKRKYFCLEDFNQPFDFHCVQKQPQSGERWYTICGMAYTNRIEYVLLTFTTGVLGITWFWQSLRNLRSLPTDKSNRPSKKQKSS